MTIFLLLFNNLQSHILIKSQQENLTLTTSDVIQKEETEAVQIFT